MDYSTFNIFSLIFFLMQFIFPFKKEKAARVNY